MKCRDCDDLFCLNRNDNGECEMEMIFVKHGTPEYEQMLRDEESRRSKISEEVDVGKAVSFLCSKGWACVAPGGIDPVALRKAASDLVDAVERYVEPKPGVPYMHRTTLLGVKNDLKKLL